MSILKKKGLGRGLSSLIGDTKNSSVKNKISISEIVRGKFQPRKIFNKEGLPYAIFDSIEQALNEAYEEVSTITNILLSPGFASYDLFKNFEDRGNCFEKSFLHLKQRISITTDKLLKKSFAH